MPTLQLLISSKTLLTKESPSTDDYGRPSIKGVLCDMEGNQLAAGAPPIATYLDANSGKRYALIATILPSNKDPQSVAQLAAIQAMKPVYYSAPGLRGYFVPAPDYTINGIDPGTKAPEPVPAAAAAPAAGSATAGSQWRPPAQA
jgi:hypothetical protein